MANVLITGGTGYLGSKVSAALLDQGLDVSVVVRENSSLEKLQDILEQISLLTLDQVSASQWDIVVHAATCYGRRGESSQDVFAANLEFPLELIGRIRRENLLLVNFDSSMPRTLNDYSESKACFVEQCRQRYSGVRFLNLVFEQFYGPGDESFISRILRDLLKTDKAVPVTRGEQKRDLLYVSDAVSAVALLINHFGKLNFSYQPIDIGCGESFQIHEVLSLLAKIAGVPRDRFDFGAVPYRDAEPMNSVADISALSDLGWKPSVSLEEGLELMVKYCSH